VVVWGTGNVGRPAIRAVVADPALELAGVIVSDPAKEGRDAADLCGLPAPTGVVATRDAASVLASAPDAVVYAATGDTRPDDAFADILDCLRVGADVVSTSVYPLIHPGSTPSAMRRAIDDAVGTSSASCWVSGIDPGFLADLLAPVLVGTCVSVDRVTVRETFNYATYHAPHAVRDLVGFGTPMDAPPPMLWPTVPTMVWGGALRILAEALGVTLDAGADGVREEVERRPLERTVELPIGTFHEGTQGAFRLRVVGMVDGVERLAIDHVTRIDDTCATDWPLPPGGSMGVHQVVVEGDPDVTLSLEAGDETGDRNVGGIALSAGRIVHALPAVAAAPAGLITALDLPLVPGRGLLRT
jgi:2,4-diaminopentanoate dehydrogenase